MASLTYHFSDVQEAKTDQESLFSRLLSLLKDAHTWPNPVGDTQSRPYPYLLEVILTLPLLVGGSSPLCSVFLPPTDV